MFVDYYTAYVAYLTSARSDTTRSTVFGDHRRLRAATHIITLVAMLIRQESGMPAMQGVSNPDPCARVASGACGRRGVAWC